MSNIYISADLGTSNFAITVMHEDLIKSFFVTFKSDTDPKDIHDLIQKNVDESVDYAKSTHGDDNPIKVFIESVFKGINQRTYMRMIRVAHSLYISFKVYTSDVEYIEPATWRKHLFGKGNKKKLECQEWAYDNYPFLLENPKSNRDHRADSLMIGLGGRAKLEADI